MRPHLHGPPGHYHGPAACPPAPTITEVTHHVVARHQVEIEIFPPRVELAFRDERFVNPINTQYRFEARVFNSRLGASWQVLNPAGGPGAGTIDSQGLYQAGPVLLGQFLVLGGNLPFGVADALGGLVIDDGLHFDQVDEAPKLGFLPQGELQEHRVGLEALHHHLEAAVQIRARAVHFVDKGQPGDAVALGLAPYGLGLGLHPAHRIKDRHHPVQDPKGALHLDGEVHVSRGVDDIDAVVAPVAGGRGGSDGDAPFLLLGHPVHHGHAVVHLSHAMGYPGVEQNPLRGRGLAGVNVGHEANISDPA